MRIIAVVVTYNRLSLLKECISALKAQTVPPSAIMIINNDSTDGTTEWLNEQLDLQVVHQPNRGGAWGFYSGIKEAYAAGADWVWAMDDDTIPEKNCLKELIHAVERTSSPEMDEFGFFASKVVWTDNSWHIMNRQVIDQHFSGRKSWSFYQGLGIDTVEFSSFVSILISRKAIKMSGLPLKEFFIWCDDIEYTQRIIRKGFAGGLVQKSIAVHKTPTNYKSDLLTDSKANIWKYRHGLRNELYTRRYHKSYGSYVRNVLKRFFVMPVKIMVGRKNDRWPFIKVIWESTWKALRFNPPKEYVD